MLGQVVRAVEKPVSLSLGFARRGVSLASRVAFWGVTVVIRELSPDGRGADDEMTVVAPVPEAPREAPPPTEETQTEESAVSVEEPVATEEPVLAPRPAQPEPIDVSGDGETVVEHEPGLGTSVRARSPHSALNNPVAEPDLTEWPDPYEQREDPRDPGDEMVFGGEAHHTPPGAVSTSEPHPSQDPEAVPSEGPRRDKLDQ